MPDQGWCVTEWDLQSPRRFDPTALFMFLPCLLVVLLYGIQTSLIRLFYRKASEQQTRLFLWLNLSSVFGICKAIALEDVPFLAPVGMAVATAALSCFLLSFLVALRNIGWALLRGQQA